MRSKWLSRRALWCHAAVVVWFPGCLIAAWWQVHVALAGDHLAYLYSVEWPVFAVFGVVFWWHVIHDDPETVGVRGLRRAQQELAENPQPDEPGGPLARVTASEDEKLSEYNDYLAGLSSRGERKTWRKS